VKEGRVLVIESVKWNRVDDVKRECVEDDAQNLKLRKEDVVMREV